MALLGEYATYKIGKQRFSYDSGDYLKLLLVISDQEEIIKKLKSQLDKKNGNIK
jgi:hypothetical protein